METMVLFYKEKLYLTSFHGEPVLWIQNSSQVSMPKMQFVGGYPDEYCIFLKDLTHEELDNICTMTKRPIDFSHILPQDQEMAG